MSAAHTPLKVRVVGYVSEFGMPVTRWCAVDVSGLPAEESNAKVARVIADYERWSLRTWEDASAFSGDSAKVVRSIQALGGSVWRSTEVEQ
jgi:hypothetical protein